MHRYQERHRGRRHRRIHRRVIPTMPTNHEEFVVGELLVFFTRRIDCRASSLSCLRALGLQAVPAGNRSSPSCYCSPTPKSLLCHQELSYALLSAITRRGPDTAMPTNIPAARNAAGADSYTG
jgi:hypothetical protein